MMNYFNNSDKKSKKNRKHRKKNFTRSKIKKFVFKLKLILVLLEVFQMTAVVIWFYQKFFRKNQKNLKHKK